MSHQLFIVDGTSVNFPTQYLPLRSQNLVSLTYLFHPNMSSTDTPSSVQGSNDARRPVTTTSLSQCDSSELIRVFDSACEENQAKCVSDKRRKVAKVTPNKDRVAQPDTESLPSHLEEPPMCPSCNMKKCHETKFGGYAVSKVLAFCKDEENVRGLDWEVGKQVYMDAYKEILRVCTYLDTDYYDPCEDTLNLPECMASSSYLASQDIVQSQVALNKVTNEYFWNGAMKKAPNNYDEF